MFVINLRGEKSEESLRNNSQVETFAPCVDYFNNIITQDEANYIIKICEKYSKDKEHFWNFENAKVGHGGLFDKLYRSNETMTLNFINNNLNDIKKVEEIILQSVSSAVRYYSFKNDINIEADEGFTLLKYKTTTEYKAHCDHGIGKPFSDRMLSMVMYLNPTEYSGGETYFNNFDISVKPKNPGLVLFPSNYAYAHQAKPVETGTKYAIVTWLRQPYDIK